MSEIREILCLGLDPELWRLDEFSTAKDLPATRVTVIREAALVAPALLEVQRWDLILCDAAAYYELRVDQLLSGVKERDASLVIARPPGSTMSPVDAYRRGAADLVTMGDREHLLMVVARELANAADRKELRRLRQMGGGSGREAMPLPKLTQFNPPSPARVEPIPMPAAPETEAEHVQDLRIKRLIEGGGLTLEYQPIVALNALNEPQQAALFEALMRLKDSSGRILQPLEFFPAAARHRWFSKLDHWVFHRALNILARMQTNASTPAGLFLNLASDTLKTPASVEPIIKTIENAAIADGSLVIEVTKDVFHQYREGVEQLCAVLRSRGHGLLIEKFTVEDCALLDQVPDLVSHVKINCALLGRMTDPELGENLKRMVQCAHEHGMKTIALAVDKADLLPRLYAAGFDYIQGHFVSMPYEDLVYPSVYAVEI